MSQDDGWIIRRNTMGQIVLQHYSASADVLPDVDFIHAMTFDSIEEAVMKYQELEAQAQPYPSEYGLSVQIDQKEKSSMQTSKYVRKTFFVDAVQVTADNMEEVAKWCQGEVREEEDGTRYIHVRVHRPLNERQTKAFANDWVLYAGTGYKVYTTKAFSSSFDKCEDPPQELRNVFEDQDKIKVN